MNKKLILLRFLILIAVLVAIVFINRKVSSLVSEANDLRGELYSLKTRYSNLQKLQTDYLAIEKDIVKVENLLPDSHSMVFFVSEVEDLAAQSGVQAKVVFEDTTKKPANTKGAKTGAGKIPLTIKATGPEAAVLAFFKRLETTPYYLDSVGFKWNVFGQGDSSLDINMEVYVDPTLKQ